MSRTRKVSMKEGEHRNVPVEEAESSDEQNRRSPSTFLCVKGMLPRTVTKGNTGPVTRMDLQDFRLKSTRLHSASCIRDVRGKSGKGEHHHHYHTTTKEEHICMKKTHACERPTKARAEKHPTRCQTTRQHGVCRRMPYHVEGQRNTPHCVGTPRECKCTLVHTRWMGGHHRIAVSIAIARYAQLWMDGRTCMHTG